MPETKAIPQRSDIAAEHTWNLGDLYADEAAWEADYQKVLDLTGRAKDFAGKAIIGKLNYDNNPQTTQCYKIQALPTFLFFKNGQLVDTVIGVVSKSTLASKLNQL